MARSWKSPYRSKCCFSNNDALGIYVVHFSSQTYFDGLSIIWSLFGRIWECDQTRWQISACTHWYYVMIGGSLSEPHTSVIALAKVCVCFKILILRRSSSYTKGLFLECSVGYLELRWLKVKYTLLFVCYRSSTAGCPQAIQIKFRSYRWLRSLQVRAMH